MNYDWLISFVAGAGYGFTSVVIGQPLDTTKTRMQAHPALAKTGMVETAKDLFKNEGIRGFYRGGLPIFIGGAAIRSAQFGFYNLAFSTLRPPGAKAPERILGIFDW